MQHPFTCTVAVLAGTIHLHGWHPTAFPFAAPPPLCSSCCCTSLCTALCGTGHTGRPCLLLSADSPNSFRAICLLLLLPTGAGCTCTHMLVSTFSQLAIQVKVTLPFVHLS